MLKKNSGKINIDILVMSVLILGCAYFFVLDRKEDSRAPAVQDEPQSVDVIQSASQSRVDKITQAMHRGVSAIKSVLYGKSLPIENKAEAEADGVNKIQLLSLQAKQQKWKSKRGYFYLPDYQRYEGLNVSQLKKKVNTGDILAMSMLIRRYKKAGYKSLVKNMVLHSAAHGATAELTILVKEYGERALNASLSTKVRLNSLNDMLAFAELAAIRGDKKGIEIGLSMLDKNDLELTRLKFKRSFARSWDMYYYILGKNTAYNLTAFNNTADALTISEVDKKLQTLPNPHGWAKKHIGTFEYK